MDFLFRSNNNEPTANQKKDFGNGCIFLARLCGAGASIVILLSGLITLLPLPSMTTSLKEYPRCLGVGFIFIITSVLMFFMEVTIMGMCVEKLAFLNVLLKYVKHWHRAVLYMTVSITPLVLWCLSISTIIPMILFFMVGALNFVLVIGQKGDHSEQLSARWQRLGDEEMNNLKDESEGDDEEEESNKPTETKLQSS